MEKVIISTTINPPTKAIRKYDEMEDWKLIVTGDRKTPEDYSLSRGTYISWEEQQDLYPEFCELVGPDSWSRGRNIAILEACKRGADLIATVDDDNIPLKGWGEESNIYVGKKIHTQFYSTNLPVFDPLYVTNYPHLWHRGFPKSLVNDRDFIFKWKTITPMFQENLWIGDPDVSAICRMIHRPNIPSDNPIKFPIPTMAVKGYSPINTQNCIFHRKILPYYMSIPFVGRCDDVFGGYILQRHWRKAVIYGEANVISERNPHDLSQDVEGEIYEDKILSFLERLDKSEEYAFELLPPKAVQAIRLFRKLFRSVST